MKKGDYQIPFDRDGNQLHYPAPAAMLTWTDNHEFKTTMRYLGFRRGRSAAYLEFQRCDTAKNVVVFLADLDPVIAKMEGGFARGTWTFCKRGKNYGCRLVEEKA